MTCKCIFICFYSIFVSLLFSCGDKKFNQTGRTVFIQNNNGKYSLYRNNAPFNIQGAGGFQHLKELHEAGGNTIRTWDTTNIDLILQDAEENHIAVILGLPIADSKFMDFYNDSAKVASQFSAIKKIIERQKANPALLMWCVGNELNFPYKLSFNNFYNAFNDIVDMIHAEDPGHPVTTALLNINGKYIFNLQRRCNVDLISFNMFNRVPFIKEDLKAVSWQWEGPYLFLEWGIDGPWVGTEQTAWGSFIEHSSTKKAEVYAERFEHNLPKSDPRFLGACIFYWGQKQEITHTWFSLFDENGNRSDVVSAAQYLWTGKRADHEAPQINYMLIDKQGARDNLIYKPNSAAHAEVVLLKSDTNISNIKWELLPEDWYKVNDMISKQKPRPVYDISKGAKGLKLDFVTPAAEGPYRLFATLYDNFGNFSTCNMPFYVVSNN